MEFDYIIAGGGAAGCLLANRLSANPAHRVLLLEAGGASDSIWFQIPVGYRYTIGNPASDWCFSGEAEPGLNQRVLKHPRGKVLGGSTAINGMVAIRGQAADYDAWRDRGLNGWGWQDVLPFFKQHEDYFSDATHDQPWHGTGGEWRIDAPRVHWPVLGAVAASAVQAGIPQVQDFNTGDNFGVGPIHVNQKNGRRWSAADAFLKPILKRGNLTVQTGALVDKVVMQGSRAVGVMWHQGGTRITATAHREVVLAAGALGSPQILMRSGIGPAAQLAFHGIDVVADRPGVGANLQDHLQIGIRYQLKGADTLNRHMHSLFSKARMTAQFALAGRGPLTMAPCQLGLFAKSGPDVAHADVGYNVLAFSRDGFQAEFDPFPGLTLISYDLRPGSRGALRLADRHASTAPLICANYLTTPRDEQVAINSIRLTRRIMRQAAMAPYLPQERWAGSAIDDGDDAGLLAVARQSGVSIFHPVGTAKMGVARDSMAVVDAQLAVIGVQNLRVIDASVMPTLISGNTATPTLMIAEKGATLILQNAQANTP